MAGFFPSTLDPKLRFVLDLPVTNIHFRKTSFVHKYDISKECSRKNSSRRVSSCLLHYQRKDGVVSPRSFEMLLQWVCHNRIVLGDLPPTKAIDAIIEFARLADIYNIMGLESSMANNLRQIILTDKTIQNSVFAKPPDHTTLHLSTFVQACFYQKDMPCAKCLHQRQSKDIFFVPAVKFSRIFKACRILRSTSSERWDLVYKVLKQRSVVCHL